MTRGCVVDVASLPLLFSRQGILGPRHDLPLPDLNVNSFEPPSRFSLEAVHETQPFFLIYQKKKKTGNSASTIVPCVNL